MSNKRQKNKKAQVSDIVTWVVATVIIIVIMVVFIYLSSLLAQKTNVIKIKEIKIDFSGQDTDWTEMKTSFAYSKTSAENQQIIDSWGEEHG